MFLSTINIFRRACTPCIISSKSTVCKEVSCAAETTPRTLPDFLQKAHDSPFSFVTDTGSEGKEITALQKFCFRTSMLGSSNSHPECNGVCCDSIDYAFTPDGRGFSPLSYGFHQRNIFRRLVESISRQRNYRGSSRSKRALHSDSVVQKLREAGTKNTEGFR